MDLQAVRQGSLAALAAKGAVTPDHLPLLDMPVFRKQVAVADRLLCLTAVAAVAYGFSSDKARAWLDQEGLSGSLEDIERRLLDNGAGNNALLQWQVQGIHVLLWALDGIELFDLDKPCPDELVHMLPDLKVAQPSATFRQNLGSRSPNEVVAMADLAYCTHWTIRDAQLKDGQSRRMEELEIMERRRALHWLIEEQDWYSIDLDT